MPSDAESLFAVAASKGVSRTSLKAGWKRDIPLLASLEPPAIVLWAVSETEPAVFEAVSEAELAAFLSIQVNEMSE